MLIENKKDIKKFNTLGLRVITEWYAQPSTVEEIKSLLEDKRFMALPLQIVGSGSNLLFNGNFNGLVIHPNIREIEIVENDGENVFIRVGAGVIWDDFVEWCVERGWGGVENLSYIPGCVGASPVQNIGAYGAEVKDAITKVEYLEVETKKEKYLSNEECKFGYRDSVFKNELRGKAIITYVTYRLSLSPVPDTSYKDVAELMADIPNPSVYDVRKAIIGIRKEKLPDPSQIGNAGSFFKNPLIHESYGEELKRQYPNLKLFPAITPMVKIPAAWLIEQCGFKGIREGNVGVHPNQALVLLAYEGATGEELLSFAEKIKRTVKIRFNIDIEMEVEVITSS